MFLTNYTNDYQNILNGKLENYEDPNNMFEDAIKIFNKFNVKINRLYIETIKSNHSNQTIPMVESKSNNSNQIKQFQ